jgi:dihydroxyacetone kinase
MNWNVLVKLGESLVGMFWQSCEVKGFVVTLLERYSKSTDNDIDDAAVALVRTKLLKNCE